MSLREPGIFAHIVVLATQIGQVGQVGQVGVPADDYSPSLALRFCMLAQSLMKQSRAVRHSSAWYTVAVAMDLPVSALGNAPKENDKGAEFAQMISRFCATLASPKKLVSAVADTLTKPQDDDDWVLDAARLEEALWYARRGADLPQGFMAIFHNGSWDKSLRYFKRSNRQADGTWGTTALQSPQTVFDALASVDLDDSTPERMSANVMHVNSVATALIGDLGAFPATAEGNARCLAALRKLMQTFKQPTANGRRANGRRASMVTGGLVQAARRADVAILRELAEEHVRKGIHLPTQTQFLDPTDYEVMQMLEGASGSTNVEAALHTISQVFGENGMSASDCRLQARLVLEDVTRNEAVAMRAARTLLLFHEYDVMEANSDMRMALETYYIQVAKGRFKDHRRNLDDVLRLPSGWLMGTLMSALATNYEIHEGNLVSLPLQGLVDDYGAVSELREPPQKGLNLVYGHLHHFKLDGKPDIEQATQLALDFKERFGPCTDHAAVVRTFSDLMWRIYTNLADESPADSRPSVAQVAAFRDALDLNFDKRPHARPRWAAFSGRLSDANIQALLRVFEPLKNRALVEPYVQLLQPRTP